MTISNYFKWSGTASRKDVWLTFVVSLVIYIGFLFTLSATIAAELRTMNAGAADLTTSSQTFTYIALALALIVSSIAHLLALARRFGTLGHSRWWGLMGCVPVLSFGALLYAGLKK